MDGADRGLLEFALSAGSDFSDKEGLREKLRERDPADYEFLREAFKSLDNPAKQMERCIQVFSDGAMDAEVRCSAAEQMQYLVEDLDVANDIHKIGAPPCGGWKPIVGLLREPVEKLRWWGAFIIATATQNNPVAQGAALSSSALAHCMGALRKESHVPTQGKLFGAILSLVKGNDTAFSTFLVSDGLNTTVRLLRSTSLGGEHASPEDARTATKAVLVLHHAYSMAQRHHLDVDGGDAWSSVLEVLVGIVCNATKGTRDSLVEKVLDLLVVLVESNESHASAAAHMGLGDKVSAILEDAESDGPEEREARQEILQACETLANLLRAT